MGSKGVILVAALLAVTLYFFINDVTHTRELGAPWVSTIVTPQEVKALSWVRVNTLERTVFASDIFGGEQLMGGALREGTEGGDWAIIPNVVQRMSDIDELFNTQDGQKAWTLARQYNATYVWAPNRQIFAGFSWKEIQREKFRDERYFQLAYSDGGMEVYRVKGA